ncbi:ABC transporter [Nocardioides mangrovicus]|uniref:ABC transporter n=1 Tax=Nocardioides mangrovicus TaxID=2478913 RepID=A0A3L8P4H6_9ACTN|nr:ABC transporter permease [Nocardioides mangrovicus]RLV49972.1 ABC transporter [Nocardioides mangrovicus]
MTSYVLFLLLGLGAGSVYSLLGLGMVLKYRSTGVVDFAQGAIAMWGAYVFLRLRLTGKLELPWFALPHEISLGTGMAIVPALLITLVYGTVLGLVVFFLVYRPLLRAAPLTKVCASVGVTLFFEAVAVLNFGTTATSAPPVLPSKAFVISGVVIPGDRIWIAGIVVAIAVALTVTFRYTRFGLATRAGAENEMGAALIGLSATRIAARNWVLATLLATLSGVLITPISSLDPTSYTLFVVPALGAVLIGRFESFWITTAAGLGLGIVQSELVKLQTVFTWLPQQGLSDGVPFLIILVTMSLAAKRLGARGATGTLRNPSLGRPTRPGATALLAFAVGVVVLVALHGSLRAAFMASIVTVCLALGLVVLTGYVGQVSLAQMSFAGFGAFVLSHLGHSVGMPFFLALLISALSAVPLGILMGLPALRVRGVNLAVVTLAAAAAMDALVFSSVKFTGGLGGRKIGSPELFGLDLGIAKGNSYPRVVFGVMLLVVVIGAGYCVARLRTSATGRMLVAVRSNERAASAVGIRVAPVKLYVFALSAFLSGLGGGLLAYEQSSVSSSTFTAQASLSLLALVYVAGVGRIAGAVVAGIMFASDGLFVSFLDKTLHVGQYQTVVAGIALALTAIQNPDGVASNMAGERGPGPRVAALRDRIIPRRHRPVVLDVPGQDGAFVEDVAGPTPVSRA